MKEKIKNITSEVYEELIKLFGAKIERIILYGSYARGDFNLESDVDIMVSLLARNSDDYENNMKYHRLFKTFCGGSSFSQRICKNGDYRTGN